MRAKDMCLKKNSFLLCLVLLCLFFYKIAFSQNSLTEQAVDYINDLSFFSGSFIQNDGDSISEGKIFIGSKRVRVEYDTPSRILIILDKNKAMYYNYDLEEDEFFNPEDTSAGFFFEIFNNPVLFYDSEIISKDNYLILEKSVNNEESTYNIKVFFEDNPLVIRKIDMLFEDSFLSLSIYNHKFNEQFNENFFKLINPSFFDQ